MNGNRTPVRGAFKCGVCGSHTAEFAHKPNRDGVWRWFLHCFKCNLGSSYPAALADAVGAPNGAALLEDPPRYLAGHNCQPLATERPNVPSSYDLGMWHRALRRAPWPREYLEGRRQVAWRVLRDSAVGWDGAHLTFPMSRGGIVVAFKTREVNGQMRKPRGSGAWSWPLYPDYLVVPQLGWVLLVAGEIDALRGLSAGLPAMSVTGGAGQWRESWNHDLRGKRVAVCFDRNEAHIARRRVDLLKVQGIDAWRVRLPRSLGPKGDLSDFLNAGGDPDVLRRRTGEAS